MGVFSIITLKGLVVALKGLLSFTYLFVLFDVIVNCEFMFIVDHLFVYIFFIFFYFFRS